MKGMGQYIPTWWFCYLHQTIHIYILNYQHFSLMILLHCHSLVESMNMYTYLVYIDACNWYGTTPFSSNQFYSLENSSLTRSASLPDSSTYWRFEFIYAKRLCDLLISRIGDWDSYIFRGNDQIQINKYKV